MIQKDSRGRILELFLDKPTYGFSLREIEKLSKVSLPSVKMHVLRLVNEWLVKSKIFKKHPLYYANRENRDFKRLKIFHNIKLLYDSGVIDYINKSLSYPTIVLFGSVVKGDDVESSDIDLFIQSPEESINLSKFEKKLGKKFNIFLYKNLKEIKNNHLINNIINGITLEGFLEVF